MPIYAPKNAAKMHNERSKRDKKTERSLFSTPNEDVIPEKIPVAIKIKNPQNIPETNA